MGSIVDFSDKTETASQFMTANDKIFLCRKVVMDFRLGG